MVLNQPVQLTTNSNWMTRHRVAELQLQTVEELSSSLTMDEQMIVSVFAATYVSTPDQPGNGYWDKDALKGLLEKLSCDVDVSVEHQILSALKMIHPAPDQVEAHAVIDTLRSVDLIPNLAVNALNGAAHYHQLESFFHAWLHRRTDGIELTPLVRTGSGKILRLAATWLVAVNVLGFIMLFIVPEFQKMFNEFELELPASMQLAMLASYFFVKWWFVFLFVLIIIGVIYFRVSKFGRFWNRWWHRAWTNEHRSDAEQHELGRVWNLRFNLPTELKDSTGESVADWDLQSWIETQTSMREKNRQSLSKNICLTLVLGAGHCLFGLTVLLFAVSIFQSLIMIIDSLSGRVQ